MAAHLTSHIFEEFQPFTCQIRYLSSFVPQLDKSLKTMMNSIDGLRNKF